MVNIIVFGNCQADALANILKRGLPKSRYKVAFLSNNPRTGGMKGTNKTFSKIVKSDILIYQPLGEQHGKLSENFIRKAARPKTDLIAFPYIFNSGMYSLGHAPMQEKHEYGYVFGEEIILSLLRKHSINTVLEEYKNARIDFNLMQRFKECNDEMGRRESSAEIKITEYILDNYKNSKLFLTHNHPTTKLLREICFQVKKLSGLPLSLDWIDSGNENIANFTQTNTPISPYDINLHGYKFDFHDNWFIKGKELIQLIAGHRLNEQGASPDRQAEPESRRSLKKIASQFIRNIRKFATGAR